MPFDRRQALNLVCLPVSPHALVFLFLLVLHPGDRVPQDPMAFDLDEPELPLLERAAMAAHRVPDVLLMDDGLFSAPFVELEAARVLHGPPDGKAPAVRMIRHFSMVASSKSLVVREGLAPPYPVCRTGALLLS